MDRAAARAFMEQFIGLVVGAGLVGVAGVADRTGIFRALAERGPSTAHAVAEAAGLHQRYVEEALAALAAGGLLEYDPDAETFTMSEAAAVCLTDDTSPYYIAGWTQAFPALMAHVPRVAEAFERGGGISYADFGEDIVAGIDRMNSPAISTLLTAKWLPKLPDVVANLETGVAVADVGCGSGAAALELAREFPASSVVGYDIDEASIVRARQRASDAGLDNVRFVQAAAEALPTDPGFDFIMSLDVVHDMADPHAGLHGIHNALTDNGVYLMVEPNAGPHLEDNLHPIGAMQYAISTLHCLPVSLAHGHIGLGTAWGPLKAEDLCRSVGFSGFVRLDIDNPMNAFYRVEK